MKAVVSILRVSSAVGTALTYKWSDCSGGRYGVVSNLSPTTIELGQETTIIGTGISYITVNSGKFNADVTMGPLNLMSCTGPFGPAKTCNLPLGFGSITLDQVPLPITPGPLSVNLKLDLAANAPAFVAMAKARVTATTENKKEVLCVELALGRDTEPAPSAAWGSADSSDIVSEADPIGQAILKFLNSQIPKMDKFIDSVVPNPLVVGKTITGKTSKCVDLLCLCEATAAYAVHLGSISGSNLFKIYRFTDFTLDPENPRVTMSVQFERVYLNTRANEVDIDLSVCGVPSKIDGQWSAGVLFQNDVTVKLTPSYDSQKKCVSFEVEGSALDIQELEFVKPDIRINIDGFIHIDLGFVNQLISKLAPRVKEEIQQHFLPVLKWFVGEVGCISVPHFPSHSKTQAVIV